MTVPFRVGLTADFLRDDGSIGFGDIGLGLLDEAGGFDHRFLKERTRLLTGEMLEGLDGLVCNAPRVTAETLAGNTDLAVIARYGVGYDTVDLEACTAHGVAVTITPDGARRPVALMVVTFIMAAAHRLLEKDRVTRAGEGWARKLDLMGYGITGKTLGIIGLGNIGSEVARLMAPFEMPIIAADPYVDPAKAAAVGARLVDIDTLIRDADFIAITCALTPETRQLVNRERIGRMKPTTFLINAARGPIVDQTALTEALQARRLRGAATDVFETEPVDPDDPILKLDNVIVAPHALCWTDEWAYITGRSIMRNLITVASGGVPEHVVNRAVLESPLFRRKLDAFRARRG